MSASQFVLGFGSTIAYAIITGGNPGTYTSIAQSVDVDSPTSDQGKVKVTNNQSPNNSQEYAPGLLEPGEVEFQVVYYASHKTLLNMQGNGIIYMWKETFSDGTICVFPGFLASATLEGKTEDDAVKGKLKIILTGAAAYS